MSTTGPFRCPCQQRERTSHLLHHLQNAQARASHCSASFFDYYANTFNPRDATLTEFTIKDAGLFNVHARAVASTLLTFVEMLGCNIHIWAETNGCLLTSSVRISFCVKSLDVAHLVLRPSKLEILMSIMFCTSSHCCKAFCKLR